MKKRHVQHGTTIVEVMAAAVIFVTAVIGSSFLFVSGRNQVRAQQQRRAGLHLAASAIEEIKVADYTTLAEGQTHDNITFENVTYDRTIDIEDAEDESFKTITVQVSWGDEDAPRDITLVTRISPER